MSALGLAEQSTPLVEAIAIGGRPQAADQITEIDRRVRTFVAEKPVLAVLCALGVGYVVGRLLSRVS